MCTVSDQDPDAMKDRIRIRGLNDSCVYRWNLKNDHSEQLIPEPGSSVQHIDLDPQALYMAVVNNKVLWASNRYLRGYYSICRCFIKRLGRYPGYLLLRQLKKLVPYEVANECQKM
jgi:hypothetical protein